VAYRLASPYRFKNHGANYPQSLTLIHGMNWEIGRLEFCVFAAGCVLPDCPGKTVLTGFPNRSDWFSPVGSREEFLSKGVSVVLWLLLFKGGKALEVFWVLGKFWGASRQNRPDRFAKPV
jgi:hypothetical protein